MPSVLTTTANEKSTAAITVSFTDENGDAVTPKTANWTLTDLDGNVINGKEQEDISSLDTSVTVVLSGNDLQIGGSETLTTVNDVSFLYRIFTVEATYDSDLGSDLPLKESCKFKLYNLEYVT